MADDTRDKPLDAVLIHGATPDGAHEVLRLRNGRVEVGMLRRMEEGRPIHGEVVRLEPREEFPLLCDVEVVLPRADATAPPSVRSGPPQVATERYRANWDAIFRTRRDEPTLYN